MKTALDLDAGVLDAGDKKFIENMRSHGWVGTHVFEDEDGSGFSYTTGFWHTFKAPELVLFSIPSEVAHQIFWNFYNDLENGKQHTIDVPISEMLDGFDVVLKPVLEEYFHDYLGRNRWFYRGNYFQAQQVFFPDRTGCFPWDADVSADFKAFQPSLAKLD